MDAGWAIPRPLPEDDEDVAWQLTTASALWLQGDRCGALEWVRRAADTALSAGLAARASDIATGAMEMERHPVPDPIESPATVEAAPAPAGEPLHRELHGAPVSERAGIVSGAGAEGRDGQGSSQPTRRSGLPDRATGRASAQARRRASSLPPFASRPPILDPWADEGSTDSSVGPWPPSIRFASGVPMPSAAPRPPQEEVITSAAPLSAPTPLAPSGLPPPAPVRHGAPASGREPLRTAPHPTPPAPRPSTPIDAVPRPSSKPPSRPRSSGPLSSPRPSAPALLGPLPVQEIEAFATLPSTAQHELVRSATVRTLTESDEIRGYGAAVVLSGETSVCAAIIDVAAHRPAVGQLVSGRAEYPHPLATRLVALSNEALVAYWSSSAIDGVAGQYPEFLTVLRTCGDRLSALAGATVGPLGELDESTRTMLFDGATVRRLDPKQRIFQTKEPLPRLYVVGAGSVVLETPKGEIAAAQVGDLIYPRAALAAELAPGNAYSGLQGAILVEFGMPLLRKIRGDKDITDKLCI